MRFGWNERTRHGGPVSGYVLEQGDGWLQYISGLAPSPQLQPNVTCPTPLGSQPKKEGQANTFLMSPQLSKLQTASVF